MPFVNIRLVKQALGDNRERKKSEMAEAIASAVASATGLPPGEVWIVFDEIEAQDWYLGEESVRSLRFSEAVD
jgi:4-oxalocrotonate tautomerase